MYLRFFQICLFVCCIPVFWVFSASVSSASETSTSERAAPVLSPSGFPAIVYVRIVLENHLFKPSKIVVPKQTKVILDIQNNDGVYEKFSSFGLNREKILLPQKVTRIYLSPLQEGRYVFSGEFHPASARGMVIVDDTKADCMVKVQEATYVCR